jgi:hypothetical protein
MKVFFLKTKELKVGCVHNARLAMLFLIDRINKLEGGQTKIKKLGIADSTV